MTTKPSTSRIARTKKGATKRGARLKVPVLLATLTVLGALWVPITSRSANADYSTPMAAATSYFNAMKAGDWTAVKSACVGTVEQKEMTVMFMRGCLASGKLDEAATARFGREETVRAFGEDLKRTAALIPATSAAITNCEVKIAGTNATLAFKPAKAGSKPEPMRLRKVGAQWKLLLEMEVPKSDFSTDMMEALASSMEKCAADITAGKFKTAAEAQLAQDTAMRAQYMQKAKGPAPK